MEGLQEKIKETETKINKLEGQLEFRQERIKELEERLRGFNLIFEELDSKLQFNLIFEELDSKLQSLIDYLNDLEVLIREKVDYLLEELENFGDV